MCDLLMLSSSKIKQPKSADRDGATVCLLLDCTCAAEDQTKLSVFLPQQEAEAVDPTPAQAKVDAPPHRRRVRGQHAANQSPASVEGGAVIGPPAK